MPIRLEPVNREPKTATDDRSSSSPNDEFHRIVAATDAKRKAEHALESVKRVIAIHSGKGGVGKTFLTCNIAYALAELHGLSVGILDADVDCPNVPKFLGLQRQLFVQDKKFQPVTHRGVRIVSMGFIKQDEKEPILLRGPAKHRIAIDLLANTEWDALDILLVDLPPGTSDVPMSLLEFGELDGVLFITSPQKEAIIDTKKSIAMVKQFGIHCIGIVENMSDSLFGKDKGLVIAEEMGIPYLGSIPLAQEIFECNERGEIAFLLPGMEDAIRPIIDAVKGEEP